MPNESFKKLHVLHEIINLEPRVFSEFLVYSVDTYLLSNNEEQKMWS